MIKIIPLIILFSFSAFANQAGSNPIGIKAHEVQKMQFADKFIAFGTAKANESVDITALASDVVEEIHFSDGQLIAKGEPIISLRADEERALLTARKAEYDDQKREYERVKSLVAKKVSPVQQLESRLSQMQAAKAQLAAAEARLKDYIITAPFDGIAGLRQVSVGALVEVGDKITTFDDISIIKLDLTLPEQFANLQAGQKIIAYADNMPDMKFNGEIKAISPRLSEDSRAITARAEIQNSSVIPANAGIQKDKLLLRPGQLLRAEIFKDERENLAIPLISLISEGNKNFVMKIVDNKTVKTQITTGIIDGENIEVISGLAEGDKLVLEGLMKVRNDSEVNVIE